MRGVDVVEPDEPGAVLCRIEELLRVRVAEGVEFVHPVDADLVGVERMGKDGVVEVVGVDVELAPDERTVRVGKLNKGFILAVRPGVVDSALDEGDERLVCGVVLRSPDAGSFRRRNDRVGLVLCTSRGDEEQAEGADAEKRSGRRMHMIESVFIP